MRALAYKTLSMGAFKSMKKMNYEKKTTTKSFPVRLHLFVNFQRFPTLDAKKLVNAPKMSAHHRGICHF